MVICRYKIISKFLQKILYVSPFVLQTIVWIPTRLFLKFFFHFEVHEVENIKKLKKPVIFAVNHSSELDPILVTAALPFLSKLSPMFYTSRERTFYKKSGMSSLFYGGFFFKLWGAYPVHIGIRNYEKAMMPHIEVLNKIKKEFELKTSRVKHFGMFNS